MKRAYTKQLSLIGRGKEVGFALIHGKHLLRYGIKTLPGKRGGLVYVQRVEQLLGTLLTMAGPQVNIIAEDVSCIPGQGALRQAIYHTAQRWQRAGYSVCFLSLSEVKSVLCGDTDATHRVLMDAVLRDMAGLSKLIPRTSASAYWDKALLALTLARASCSACT